LSDPVFAAVPTSEDALTEAITRRFDLGNLDGVRVVVVVHPDGQRDIHLLTTDDNEPVAVLQFTEAQARDIARALDGGALLR
jgi:K+/H+ antiporter YhaU regulatory subunit KhtT